MKINPHPVAINRTSIECCVWHIQRYLMDRYGVDQAVRDVSPLSWYIGTDRASLDFLRRLINAKPFMVGRILHKGGSDEDVIKRVKGYLGADD